AHGGTMSESPSRDHENLNRWSGLHVLALPFGETLRLHVLALPFGETLRLRVLALPFRETLRTDCCCATKARSWQRRHMACPGAVEQRWSRVELSCPMRDAFPFGPAGGARRQNRGRVAGKFRPFFAEPAHAHGGSAPPRRRRSAETR